MKLLSLLGLRLPSFIRISQEGGVYLFVYTEDRRLLGIARQTKYVVALLTRTPKIFIAKGFDQIIDGTHLIFSDHNGEPRNCGRIVDRFNLRFAHEPGDYALNAIYVASGRIFRVTERSGRFFVENWGPFPSQGSFLEVAGGISSFLSEENIELYNEVSGEEPKVIGPLRPPIFMNGACLSPHRREKGQRTLFGPDNIEVKTKEVIPPK